VRFYGGDTRTPFNVHDVLLEKNTRFLELGRNEDGTTSANIDASSEAVHYFAQWLYHDITLDDMLGSKDELDREQLTIMLEAHVVGSKVGCFDFMDVVLDEMMKGLCAAPNLCAEFIIVSFANAFRPNSGGWNMAIDLLLNIPRPKCDLENCVYDYVFDVVDSKPLISELARRVSKIEKYKTAAEDLENPEFFKILVFGYLQVKSRDNEDEAKGTPWTRAVCQYHRHKELGLPCYQSKC
jgi:hypothetical protein